MPGLAKNDLRETLARSVCFFLAEMLRTRKVKLRRAADIAGRIVEVLPGIQSESHFLQIIRQMEYEFQELRHLESDLLFVRQVSERQRMEEIVRDFVVSRLPRDPLRAVAIMERALAPGETLEMLARRFEDFAAFIIEKKEGNLP